MDLYSTINSLVPHQRTTEATSLSYQLDEAANHIKRLQTNLERMKERKDNLKGIDHKPAAATSSVNSKGAMQIEIHEIGSALEVVLIIGLAFKYMFIETIRLLHEEGVDIVNASFNVVEDTVFHTIHSKPTAIRGNQTNNFIIASMPLCQVFSITRQSPELIGPATPRTHVVLQLSDIDDQKGLWFQVPLIFFYENNPSSTLMKGKDPVKVIKEALSRALVYYYPFAGRLREGSNGKLMVDCNGEGVLFIEADANFTLEQLGDEVKPPSPYFDELLYNVPGSEGTLGCPLLLIQVTRLLCGGFVLALRWNHTTCDAFGIVQFLKAIQELSWDAQAPSLLPTWQRELLNARNPPQITFTHHEYDEIDTFKATLLTKNQNDIDHKSVYFGPKEIASLRNQLPPHLIKNCTTFELLTACIWKCRTIALELDPDEIVRFSFTYNIRGKRYCNMQIPKGYYGNTFVYPAVCSKVDALCENPLGYAVELVKEAKAKVSEEYIRSVADLMVIKGRPGPTTMGDLYSIVSDTTRVGFEEIDLGWGKPLFAGIAGSVLFISFYVNYQNRDNGESGIVVPIRLPFSAMERFQEEVKKMTC